MSEARWTRTSRWFGSTPLLILICLAALLGAGLVITRAQSQACRDANNTTICGDEVFDIPGTTNGGGFAVRGNVRLGPKGLPPVVQVDDIGSIFDGSVLNQSVTRATFFHFNQADPNTGAADFLIGDVRM